MLREELQLLQEQGSYVGEVVKPMDKKKVLVKVSQNKLIHFQSETFNLMYALQLKNVTFFSFNLLRLILM